MPEYSKSLPGRLLGAAIGVFLTGGGIAALTSGITSVAIIAVASLVGVVLGIFSMGLSLRDYGGYAIIGIIALPWVLFLGNAVAWLAMEYATMVGVVELGAGLFILLVAVMPTKSAVTGEHRAPAHA